jgi:cell division protein FtsW
MYDGSYIPMSRTAPHSADYILLLFIIGLTLFGFMMVASASSVVGERFRDDTYYFFKHQVFYGGVSGLAAFLVGFFVPYYRWRVLALPALLVALVLLILVFVPGLQVRSGEASRWIAVGPITLQPAEFMKLAFLFYLAALLERKEKDIGSFKDSVLPFLIITGLICTLVILQPDVGTLFIITTIAFVLIFAAGFRLRHLFMIVLGGALLFGILMNTARYRIARIIVYLHPELDPKGIGYQINQALLAVGTGGWWGLGFGRSRQKYHYLPEPATDSIFAIIAEELGLIRTSLVVLAFAAIIWRGYAIARLAPDTFGRLLACGVATWIGIQAFVNMGSILALTPLTGIPLPFISYGGSALATILFASGVLLNISKYTSED